jgi:hypothetical protein
MIKVSQQIRLFFIFMNIHPRPDQELAIHAAIKAGLIRSEIDILDVGLATLQIQQIKKEQPSAKKTLLDVFAPLRGDSLDWSRNPSIGRDVEL